TVMWDDMQFDLKLINSAGDILLQKNSVRSEVRINAHWINPGIYYIRLLDTNGRSVVKKVMIQ
ncbi:MAG: T9SS type A sorting domain-containing protein, partial [Saprospiraceae bacterium]|nr:T9SS type A sorting domain-containing protein [Saprospiraceae bacterium]